MSGSNIDASQQNAPMFIDRGCGVWTITYYWRDEAEALVKFRRSYPTLRITAMLHTPLTRGDVGKITLVTEIPTHLQPYTLD